jgi:hypothetical protein
MNFKKIIAREGLVIICLMLIAAFVFAEDSANEKTRASFYFDAESAKIPPEFCPECRVKLKAVPIVYGLPAPELTERAKRGEVVLGGCNVYDGQPYTALICPKCNKVISEY